MSRWAMNFPAIDKFMKETGLASEPAFEFLHFMTSDIPSSGNRHILGLYYPIGDMEQDGFGYLPPSTIILPTDSSEGTLLHELGHRYGHFYYNNLSEEFAENYRKEQESRLNPVFAGSLARSKEVSMERIASVTHICQGCPEKARGASKLCAWCDYGKPAMSVGLPLAAVTINAPILVAGFPALGAGADFLFKATITAYHPDNNVNYAPAANEVKAQLWRNHWWILPDEMLFEAVAPAGGVVDLIAVNIIEETLFYIRAIHITTGNQQESNIRCRPDGTYQFGW
jgi:hypothetical protein